MNLASRLGGLVLLVSLSGCAGDSVSLDARGNSTPTEPAATDPKALPVTYDDGQIRFDPPGGVASVRTEAEVRSDVGASDASTVVFALYTSWNTGRMHDEGSVGPDYLRHPVWMIRTPDVPQDETGQLGGPAHPVPTTAHQSTPTTVRHVDMLGVVDDASGALMMTRADMPDSPPAPWTGAPPKSQRGTSCPADLSQYGEAGLVSDGGTPTPVSTIKTTQPRAVVHAANGDVYLVWGGEGSYDHPVSPTNMGDGVVMVQHYPADPCQTDDPRWGQLTFHHEPSRTGVVTLTAIDGNRVIFRTAGGTSGTYDVVTQAFAR